MERIELATQAAAAAWKVDPQTLVVEEVSDLYPWTRVYDVFIANNQHRRQMLVAANLEDAFTFDRYTGLPELEAWPLRFERFNQLLAAENASLPNGVAAHDLALAARCFVAGPGGFVGRGQFWEEQSEAIPIWIGMCPQYGRETFRQNCKDPEFELLGPAAWRLDFRYFNKSGGVEAWHLEGNERALTVADCKTAELDGTFIFPFA